MKRKEAKFQTLWNKYLRETRIPGFFELKQTEKNSLPFSAIEIHQYESLQAAEKTGLVWKLSDEDQRIKPCDALSVPPLPAYLVIKFPDAFYMIRIGEIVNLRESGVISISLEKAQELAEKVVRLG